MERRLWCLMMVLGLLLLEGGCETVVVANNIAWGKEEGGCSSGVM